MRGISISIEESQVKGLQYCGNDELNMPITFYEIQQCVIQLKKIKHSEDMIKMNF